MDAKLGGIIIVEKLEKLKQEIREYYGQLNELRNGVSRKIPVKPDAMVLYELCRDMRIPLVAGGLVDQPHIWLLEASVVKQETELLESLFAGKTDASKNTV